MLNNQCTCYKDMLLPLSHERYFQHAICDRDVYFTIQC